MLCLRLYHVCVGVFVFTYIYIYDVFVFISCLCVHVKYTYVFVFISCLCVHVPVLVINNHVCLVINIILHIMWAMPQLGLILARYKRGEPNHDQIGSR